MCWTCHVFGNDQIKEAGKWLKTKMMPEGIVKVDYEHYFPLLSNYYADKPVFILICDLEEEEEDRSVHCNRRSSW